jgi:hypothetical protein
MLLFCFLPLMAQTKYHVNINSGNDLNDGLKWSTAFKNLQTALDKAEAKDTVWVASGIYTPTKKYADKYRDGTPTTDRDCSFIMRDSVVLMGGFPANPSDATGLGSRNWKTNETILSGDLNTDDAFGYTTDNAYHVIIVFNATPKTVLDGFYISGGHSNAPKTAFYNDNINYSITHGCGGAIYSFSNITVASPTLRNLVIQSNSASYEGGGLFNFAFNDDASPEITQVEFINNKAESDDNEGGHGGGLYIEGTTNHAKLTNIIITGNSALSKADSHGGGVYFKSIDNCKPEIQNTLITGNIANAGGGIYCRSWAGSTAPVLTNVTISGNKAIAKNNTDDSEDGGGMAVIAASGSADPIIRNTAICDNAGDKQNELLIIGRGGSSPTYSHSFIKGMNLEGTNLNGDTNTELMFANPGNAEDAPTGNTYYNYQLRLESPLINKGNNTYITLSEDPAGQTRIYNGTVDIGAYESQGKEPVNNETAFGSKAIWSHDGKLYVDVQEIVTLRIYSLNGTLVQHIDNLGEGVYIYTLPQGLYFVTLSNGTTEKVVIR